MKIRNLLPNWTLIHFGLSSVGCMLVDNAVFTGVCVLAEFPLGRELAIFMATVAAYAVSGHCNYFYNQRYVFRSVATLKSYFQYWGLVLVNGTLLVTATELIVARLDVHGLKITLVKFVCQDVLFFFSYAMQRFFIFRRRQVDKGVAREGRPDGGL